MKKKKAGLPSEVSGKISKEMSSLRILEMAIYSEQSAYDFYLNLSNQIENQSGKEKFKFLAEDEKRHRCMLEGEYLRENKQSKFKFDAKKVKSIEAKIDTQSSAVDALDLAIQLEREAYKFYIRASEKAEEQPGKKMFLKLAEEEDRHYNVLAAERQALSSNFYWYEYNVPGVMEE